MSSTERAPLIYRNRAAQEALGRIRTAKDIDRFVSFVMTTHFRDWLGYKPPLIIHDPQLPGLISRAMDSNIGLLTPDNFASAFWNEGIRDYNGTAENLRASFVPFDVNLAKNPKKFVHVLSSVTFMVEGDLLSETRAVEGYARRNYMLYLTHLTKPHAVPRHLLDRALRYYTREELWNKRAVYLTSGLDNGPEIRRIKAANYVRVEGSRRRAELAERKGLAHPLPGGLPGLGKSS